jgi:hypothetical protein
MLPTLNSPDEIVGYVSGTFQPRCEITAIKPNYTASQIMDRLHLRISHAISH